MRRPGLLLVAAVGAMAMAAAARRREDPREIYLIHGFAHSGTTIVGWTLKEAKRACWVGKSFYHEAQWCQDIYPAWRPRDAVINARACANHTAWARATQPRAKRDAIDELAATPRRAAVVGRALLDRWRGHASRHAGDGACAAWVAKDPRLDTVAFLPRVLGAAGVETTTVLVMRHPWAAAFQSEQSGASPPAGNSARRWRGKKQGGPAEAEILRYWLAAWRDAFSAALALDRWCLQRMEDVLLGAPPARRRLTTIHGAPPARRRLTLRGPTIKPEYAYAFAARTTFYAVDDADTAFVTRTFGYDLADPAATARHDGSWFSVGGGADRLPPTNLVPAWPSGEPAQPATTAFHANCVACRLAHWYN